MNEPPTRLAIVLSHPTQYYSPWFRWLTVHAPVTVRVFYLWDFGVTVQHDPQFATPLKWDVDLLSGYESEFVPNTARQPGTHHFGGLRNPALTARLEAWRPSVVLSYGYRSWSQLRVIAWARRRRIPLLFRGDSHFLGRGVPSGAAAWLLRALYAQFAGFLYVGAANREYFTALGVPGQKLHFSPHSVDAAWFNPESLAHGQKAAALRQQLGVAADTRVILFAGKLIAAKQPAELLRAFITARPTNTALLFVGEGPEKDALHSVARSDARAAVHFLPFANQSEMPSRYLLADLFVLPSRGHYETWGLAINEAMHMGVPVLVSNLVGCARDLVTEPDTGWVYDAEQPTTLSDKLVAALAALQQPGRREQLRANVRARIAGFTYRQTTAGLLAALRSLPAAS